MTALGWLHECARLFKQRAPTLTLGNGPDPQRQPCVSCLHGQRWPFHACLPHCGWVGGGRHRNQPYAHELYIPALPPQRLVFSWGGGLPSVRRTRSFRRGAAVPANVATTRAHRRACVSCTMRSGTPIVDAYNDGGVDSAVYTYDHDRDSMGKSAPEAPASLPLEGRRRLILRLPSASEKRRSN